MIRRLRELRLRAASALVEQYDTLGAQEGLWPDDGPLPDHARASAEVVLGFRVISAATQHDVDWPLQVKTLRVINRVPADFDFATLAESAHGLGWIGDWSLDAIVTRANAAADKIEQLLASSGVPIARLLAPRRSSTARELKHRRRRILPTLGEAVLVVVAAWLLGWSAEAVRKSVRRGHLVGAKVGSRYWVSTRSIDQLRMQSIRRTSAT